MEDNYVMKWSEANSGRQEMASAEKPTWRKQRSKGLWAERVAKTEAGSAGGSGTEGAGGEAGLPLWVMVSGAQASEALQARPRTLHLCYVK